MMHLYQSTKILNYFYEWPKTRQEANIFAKEVFRVPNFWKDLAKKLSYQIVAAGGDTAIKLSVWQTMYGGTWSPQDYPDSMSQKPFFAAIMAFLPTCFLTVPFDNAYRAYYADKTWPVELRRNYTSPLQALIRIPFEENPSYLFRGAFPIAANQFMFWTIFIANYNYLKNKFFMLWVYNDWSYEFCKLCMMTFSYGMGVLCSYPFYHIREMVDLWPKERGGFCTWNNNYRVAAKWMISNVELLGYNYFRNFTLWQNRYGIPYFIATWVADSLGMMSNNHESVNSLEAQFPIFSEGV
jgi:hypothetical protein